ncbi:hypothetical protein BP5796_10809 [Coleophoma crateriformis]|uniref:Uncharacterized protein n=1 Tax=Coleophoma crateriformis TaxID=565419 RepID=A0A3D8QL84_9HELO|nr:hypothetical protein BP5796_10809 [Coleophoma crateriformis]
MGSLPMAAIQPQQVVLSLLTVGVLSLLSFAVYRLTFHPLAKYPGPVLAKLTSFYKVYHAYIGDMHLDVERCHKKYGPFVRYGPDNLLVNTVEGFHDIYGTGKKIKKGPSYVMHGPGNLIGVRDKKYFARLKRIFSQGFSDSALRDHEPKVRKQIDIFCNRMEDEQALEKGSSGWTLAKNMSKWCNYLTTDVVNMVVFSTSWDLLTSPKNRGVSESLATAVRMVGITHQTRWLYQFKLGPVLFPHLIGSILGLRKHTLSILGESKKAREENPDIKDVFAQFINAEDPATGTVLSADTVRLNSGTLIIAGSDTTSSSLAGTFFYLARDPEAYAKVVNEVRSTFPTPASIRAGAELNSCVYLRGAINEALRMSPVVIQPLWREVESPGASIGGQFIPAGMVVGSGIYSLHHDPVVFPDPYRYDIERWVVGTPEEMKTRQHHFAPFSVGPRQCLAKNFAMMEMLLTMANVVTRMDFKLPEGDAAKVGGGGKGQGWAREREGEFQMKSWFTSHVNGPMITFKKRQLE